MAKIFRKVLMRVLVVMMLVLMSVRFGDCHKPRSHPRTKPFIDPETRTVRDKDGRHLILHGVNVVYKVPPYIPD